VLLEEQAKAESVKPRLTEEELKWKGILKERSWNVVTDADFYCERLLRHDWYPGGLEQELKDKEELGFLAHLKKRDEAWDAELEKRAKWAVKGPRTLIIGFVIMPAIGLLGGVLLLLLTLLAQH